MAGEKSEIHGLLVQFKHGNTEAMVPLYACLVTNLYDKAVGKGGKYGGYGLSHEDAWDVIQQTFYRICDRIQTYEKGGGRAWIQSIFKNEVVNLLRQKQ